MDKILDLYNDVIDMETDMILNPDDYDEAKKKECKALIAKTIKHLRALGFIIDEEGELVAL